MLKEKAKLVAFWVYLTEMSLVVSSFYAAFVFRNVYFSEKYGPLAPFESYLWLVYTIFPLWSFLFYYFSLYESQRTKPFWKEMWKIAKVSFSGTLFLMGIVFAFKADYISRLFITLFGGISFLFLVVERRILRTMARLLRKRGYNYRNILVVGTGRRARELAEVVVQNKHWGLNLIGFIVDHTENKIETILKSPVLGTVAELPQLLHKYVVDELIFAVSRKRLENLEEIFLLCEEQGIRTRVAVNFFPHMIAKVHLEDLHGIPLLTFTTTPYSELQLSVKRGFDLVVSSLLVLCALPFSALIATMVKWSSPGPILFKQVRVGLNGRRFKIYKFRTMIFNAEEKKGELLDQNHMEGPVFKMKDDPRLTPVGRWLRKVSFDEIPQLINVFRGQMSLVGPRPPLPEEVGKYERWQRRRLSMKPGLTCLWQINGRNHITNFNQWMKLDLEYIDHWSLSLDLKIFLKTIPVVLFGKGAS